MIIYFDKSVINWKVIAGAWLKDRRQLEVRLILSFLSDMTLRLFSVFEHVSKKSWIPFSHFFEMIVHGRINSFNTRTNQNLSLDQCIIRKQVYFPLVFVY